MDKRDNPLFSYADLDSQRLKDTFFSPPKKKRKKKNTKKRLITLSAIALVILLTAMFFFAKYDLMVVARQVSDLPDNTVSLLSMDMLESVQCTAEDKRLMKKENSFIYLTIPKERVAISFTFKKPVDLYTGALFVYLKKSDAPLNMGVVVRDTRFFSNSLNPLAIEINQVDSSFIKVPISFTDTKLQNTNLYQVKQIILYFYPQDKEKINWTLIKDLVII